MEDTPLNNAKRTLIDRYSKATVRVAAIIKARFPNLTTEATIALTHELIDTVMSEMM